MGVAKRAGTEEGLRRRCNLRGGEGLGKWAVDEERGERFREAGSLEGTPKILEGLGKN